MLKTFSSDELVLDEQEAWKIIEFFFGGDVGIEPGSLTDRDRSFAQALIIEAIDKSYAMSWIETLWKSSVKPTASAKGIIKALAKKALKDWFNDGDAKKWVDTGEFPELYQSIVNEIARNWRSEWRIRVETGQFVGY